MLKITEVLANPEGADAGAEYIIVRNTGNQTIAINGWSITNGAGKKIPLRGSVLPGGELKVSTGAVALKNAGDSLRLVDSAGAQQDAFSYGVAASGQVLQPAAFLTDELKGQLFEELAATRGEESLAQVGSPSSGIVFSGIFLAVLLALLAVAVLKQVRYDEVIKDPLKKNEEIVK